MCCIMCCCCGLLCALQDSEVGAVVALLKERGLWDDTLLVFHSDNGGEIMGAGEKVG